jgi:hypothetical protein
MKCKLADKAFYMAKKMKILDDNDITMKEIIRSYGYENISPKAKIVLANLIIAVEEAIKGKENG